MHIADNPVTIKNYHQFLCYEVKGFILYCLGYPYSSIFSNTQFSCYYSYVRTIQILCTI